MMICCDLSVQEYFSSKIKSPAKSGATVVLSDVYRSPELAYLFKNKTYLYIRWNSFFKTVFSVIIGTMFLGEKTKELDNV